MSRIAAAAFLVAVALAAGSARADAATMSSARFNAPTLTTHWMLDSGDCAGSVSISDRPTVDAYGFFTGWHASWGGGNCFATSNAKAFEVRDGMYYLLGHAVPAGRYYVQLRYCHDSDSGTGSYYCRATNVLSADIPKPGTPETRIDAGPSGATGDDSPIFAFHSSEPGSTFRCALDSGAYAPCVSPRAYGQLADGGHTFFVKAIDSDGNRDPTPASRSFVVDTAAPSTRIASIEVRSHRRKATFRFLSSERRSTFSCKLDSRAWRRCESPRSYRRLKLGHHTFEVYATDAAGNRDRSAATRRFALGP